MYYYNMCNLIISVSLYFLNLLIQSMYASTEAVTMSVLAPKP